MIKRIRKYFNFFLVLSPVNSWVGYEGFFYFLGIIYFRLFTCQVASGWEQRVYSAGCRNYKDCLPARLLQDGSRGSTGCRIYKDCLPARLLQDESRGCTGCRNYKAASHIQCKGMVTRNQDLNRNNMFGDVTIIMITSR